MKYKIMMMDCNEDNRYHIFTGYDDLSKLGLKIETDRYKKVYEGILYIDSIEEALSMLWQMFNIDPPKDYKGRSMSVSDIIILYVDGEMRYYYVDRFGFKEISTKEMI